MRTSWTDLHDKKIKIGDLSQDAIDLFIQAGIKSKRMSSKAAHSDRETLLRNYSLMDDEGLKKSAAILFLPRTKRSSYSPDTKIGAFDEKDMLLRDDWIDGPVISRPDRIMNIILEKYIQGTYDIEGLKRVTKYPYPVKAIREAVMNSTVHRDYSSSMETSIKVYPNRLEIFNPGRLPEGWTAENLLRKHSSKPANETIAKVFYDMEYIEKWGFGIGMMRKECKEMGLPEPEYEITSDGIEIIFRLPEKNDENVPKMEWVNLKGNEFKIYGLIHEGKVTTAPEMAKSIGISERTVRRIAAKLIERGYIERIGGDKTGKWAPVSKRDGVKE
jgi:ATP-dependent DNA helicase RecG